MRFLPVILAIPLGLAGSCARAVHQDAAPSMPAFQPVVYTPESYQSVLIAGVPHVEQRPDFCGEACAEMYLRKLGKPLTQDQVFGLSGLDPAQGRGCYTAELNTALHRIGFDTGPVWSSIAAGQPLQLEAQWQALYADLRHGMPSIVCMHYDAGAQSSEHFRLVLGYDAAKDDVVYHEPAIARGSYRHMPRAQFLKLWPLHYAADTDTIIRLRLDPAHIQNIRQQPVTAQFSAADYAQHILQLKARLPAGFSVVLQPPFVVIGDAPPAEVRADSTNTVQWAVQMMKQDFFKSDPKDILDIWLFKDKTSYDKYTKQIFGDSPDTPYGYYSSAHKALIMNIATGAGTLVHEIVHPFMATNFPACPPWFNEGMGSLYEQCGAEKGHIHGYTNWRLAGLQDAIKAGDVPSFKELMALNEAKFYNEDRGTNYGQSRYLCYYLQEQGLLVKFYNEFTAHAKTDPTGYETLQRVLGVTDMDAFQKQWEAYVLKLHFP